MSLGEFFCIITFIFGLLNVWWRCLLSFISRTHHVTAEGNSKGEEETGEGKRGGVEHHVISIQFFY